MTRKWCAVIAASVLTLASAARADDDAGADAAAIHAFAQDGGAAAMRQLAQLGAQRRDLRPVIATEIASQGGRILPGLIAAAHDPLPPVRRWALAELEALGKKTPGDAVQTRDNDVLAAILAAYGASHDADALSVVLSFVNSDRTPVRHAARDAIAAYGQDALGKLRETYTNLLSKPAPVDWTASEVAAALFTAYDRLRLQDVDALTYEGLARQAEGKLAEAVADFDKVLARQPALERRAEMVPAYVLYAQSIEDTDRPRAQAYLRKALLVFPDGPRAGQIKAELAYLEAEDLRGRGVADRELLARAVALDPGNTRARVELDRLDALASAREERLHHWGEAGAAAFLAICGIVLWNGRPRRSPMSS